MGVKARERNFDAYAGLYGRMTPEGYRPVNHASLSVLTRDGVGLDPLKDLTPDQLAEAGHPRKPSSVVITAMRRYMGLEPDRLPEGMAGNRYTDMRGHCLTCAENVPEVKRCAVIDCPFWPYRLGKNPHNPRRGTPFGKGKR